MDALKYKLRYLYVVCCLLCTSVLLAGCGKKKEVDEVPKAGGLSKFLGLIFLIIGVSIVASSIIKTVKSYTKAKQGTNVMSRASAHKRTQRHMRKGLIGCIVADVIELLGIFICKAPMFPIMGFVIALAGTIGMVIWTVRYTKDSQRVNDQRYATKAKLQATGQLANPVGRVIGCIIGGTLGLLGLYAAVIGVVVTEPIGLYIGWKLGGKIGGGAGKAIGNIADEAQKGMQVDGYRDLDLTKAGEGIEEVGDGVGSAMMLQASGGKMSSIEEAADDTKQLMEQQKATARISQIADTELFKQKAMRLGCSETMSLGEMAKVVLKYAPATSLKELPEGLSDEEKAVALLGAFKHQQKALPIKKEQPVIEGEYREV